MVTDVWALVIFKMLRIILAAFLHRALLYVTVELAFIKKTWPWLKALVAYIDSTWVYSPTFGPADRSVYGQAIRTNNDLEGWHNALHRRAGGRVHKPFYLLIQQACWLLFKFGWCPMENWEGSKEESIAPSWPRSLIYGMGMHPMSKQPLSCWSNISNTRKSKRLKVSFSSMSYWCRI